MDPIAWGLSTHHTYWLNQAARVAVSLGEDVAGEGARSLAAVTMETHSYFTYLSNPQSHFQKYS